MKNKTKLFTLFSVIIIVLVFQVLYAKAGLNIYAKYTGSEKCERCHKEEYQGWKNTLHSLVVQDVKKDKSAILGDFSDPAAKSLIKKYDIEYTIGSHWLQRYLVKIDNEHYALPIVWSVVAKNWEPYSVSNWRKEPYSTYCIGCHTTNYNPADKSYTEKDVGCEACHGPGSDHIDTDGDVKYIVNPANLSDKLQDMVCAACHVRAVDKAMKYQFPIGFKPGNNLSDYIYVYYKGADETNEEAIINEFNTWKEKRSSPKECSACGIVRPAKLSLHNSASTSETSEMEPCFECHDFEGKYSDHTHHPDSVNLKCVDCHKVVDSKNAPEKKERNIHSYGYYMVHNVGCYDPLIEKQCIKCHKDKKEGWAIPFVIDWEVPIDFMHSE